MKVRRGVIRGCPRERPGTGRVLPEPPLSSPSPSLGSSGWGRIRVCKERCDSEGQREAESDSARPPRLPAPFTSRRAALSHREHRVRQERRGRRSRCGPAALASPGGWASPTRGGQRASAASRGCLQAGHRRPRPGFSFYPCRALGGCH